METPPSYITATINGKTEDHTNKLPPAYQENVDSNLVKPVLPAALKPLPKLKPIDGNQNSIITIYQNDKKPIPSIKQSQLNNSKKKKCCIMTSGLIGFLLLIIIVIVVVVSVRHERTSKNKHKINTNIEYVGCFDSDSDEDTFEKKSRYHSMMSPEYCLEKCQYNKYAYAGITKTQCYCSNNVINTNKLKDESCNIKCLSSSYSCGGDRSKNYRHHHGTHSGRHTGGHSGRHSGNRSSETKNRYFLSVYKSSSYLMSASYLLLTISSIFSIFLNRY